MVITMNRKKYFLTAVISIAAIALLARAVGILHTLYAILPSPTEGEITLTLFLQYLYPALDAVLLGVSVAAIARARFIGTNRSAALIFAVASAVYFADSAASYFLDVAFDTLSYDPALAIATLVLQAFYRTVIYAVAWLVASLRYRRRERLTPNSSDKAKFFASPLGAAAITVIICFAIGTLTELLYDFNFALNYSFQLTPSEISSVIGSLLLTLLTSGMIPAFSVYAYFAITDRFSADKPEASAK